MNRYSKLKRTLCVSLVALLLLLLGTTGASAYYVYDRVTKALNKAYEPIGDGIGDETSPIGDGDDKAIGDVLSDEEDMNANTELPKEVINIMLFGLDARTGERGRSDAMMLASYNTETRIIKLVSFQRDLEVEIPGHGKEKMAHAYAYGGAKLALQTVNKNFNLDVMNYATVNFYGMEDIIDVIGGIEIDVQSSEINAINKSIGELNNVQKKPKTQGYLKTSGPETLLTGRQAVAYARMRKADNDYKRTERQRYVVDLLLKKIIKQAKSNPFMLPDMLDAALPMVKTSLPGDEILRIGTAVIMGGADSIEQERLPADGEYQSGTFNGTYLIRANMQKTVDRLHTFLYGENH